MKKINMYYRGIWLPLLILTLGFGCKMTNGEAQDTNHRYTNGLINESSPYLLQHAHNPVNWQPWSDEALSKAKAENKLLIISIGYASCHWCHVMEHESFEDTAVARIMNEHFIPIKVDREERPDVDNVYMAACQLATQEGCGWPLNSFALPDGRPVWAGTYFPKKNWLEILEYFVKEWENDPGRMKEYAEQLTQGINELDAVPGTEGAEEFSRKFMENVGDKLLKRIDFQRGGRKGAPKFPMPSNYQFLLKYHHLTGEPKALDAVTVTLDEMAMGGIYDHLGGGFARYSVDDKWLVPHFEKMLYDNGQLVSLYSNAYQVTRDPRYKKVVEETLDYIEREMTSPEGAFYSSLDADSEGEEGKFYVWTKPEIDSILGPEKAGIFNDYYEVSKKGNWEHGKNILHRKVPAEEIANRHGISVSELEQLIDAAKEQLFVAREQRVRPGLDDKALTAWNALMLKGYVDAYRAFGADKYLQMALKNGNFIAGSMMQEDGRLNRNYKDGKSVINAFLDDYALTIDAFIALYQVTFDEAWLERAKSLAAYALAHFVDEETGFFYYTSDLDPPLITRKMDTSDNVIPGSNSMMANGLHLLGLYYYENDWIDRARNMMHRMSSAIKDSDSPDFFSNWVQLYLDLVRPPYEVAIVGPDAAGKRDELLVHYLPHAILLGGTGEGSLELLEGKLQEGETMIYVCRNKVCKLPVTQVDDALPLMK